MTHEPCGRPQLGMLRDDAAVRVVLSSPPSHPLTVSKAMQWTTIRSASVVDTFADHALQEAVPCPLPLPARETGPTYVPDGFFAVVLLDAATAAFLRCEPGPGGGAFLGVEAPLFARADSGRADFFLPPDSDFFGSAFFGLASAGAAVFSSGSGSFLLPACFHACVTSCSTIACSIAASVTSFQSSCATTFAEIFAAASVADSEAFRMRFRSSSPASAVACSVDGDDSRSDAPGDFTTEASMHVAFPSSTPRVRFRGAKDSNIKKKYEIAPCTPRIIQLKPNLLDPIYSGPFHTPSQHAIQ